MHIQCDKAPKGINPTKDERQCVKEVENVRRDENRGE